MKRNYKRGDVIYDHAHERYGIVLEVFEDHDAHPQDTKIRKAIYHVLFGMFIETIHSMSFRHIPGAYLSAQILSGSSSLYRGEKEEKNVAQ